MYKIGLSCVRWASKTEVMLVRTNGGDAEPSGHFIGPHKVNNMMSHLFMTQYQNYRSTRRSHV